MFHVFNFDYTFYLNKIHEILQETRRRKQTRVTSHSVGCLKFCEKNNIL